MSGAITAEERAKALFDNHAAGGWRSYPRTYEAAVAAILAAEDAALERAARLAAEHSVGFGCAALPDVIRALKSDGSGK
jgi:hypothetical protein